MSGHHAPVAIRRQGQGRQPQAQAGHQHIQEQGQLHERQAGLIQILLLVQEL